MEFSRNLFGIRTFFPVFDAQDALFEQIFLHSPIAVCVTEENGTILYSNHAFTQLTGYAAHELIDNNLSILKSSKNTLDFFTHFWDKLINEKSYDGKIWNKHKDGLHALHEVTVTPIALDKTYYLSTHIDVTQEIELQEKSHYLAYHDPHTGLANRSLFEDRFAHALENASRTGNSVGILYCDLNEFKQINDEHGHAVGDRVLVEVAKRLGSFFRTNDTIARFGGDEFVIVVEYLEDDTHLARMSDALTLAISQPMEELSLCASMSIGTASFPQDGLTKEQLLSIADYKMYHHKNQFYGLVD